MRPRVLLSLCLSALSLAAVACTALLGDFEEGVAGSGDAGDVATLDATSDAVADADAGSAHINYSCKAGDARFVSSFSTGMKGSRELFLLHAPDRSSNFPPRVVMNQPVDGDGGTFLGVRTYEVNDPSLDAGALDLEGGFLAAQDFPGGIAALTLGVRHGSEFREGVFLSKLYDGARGWTKELLLSDDTVDECSGPVDATLHIVDEKTDDYVVVWSVLPGTRNDAGTCESGELARVLYGRHFVGGQPSTVHRMTPSGGGDEMHFGSSPIALFDGGVVTLLETGNNGEKQVFLFSTSDMQQTRSSTVPQTVSGTNGGAVAVALGVSSNPLPSESIRSAFLVVDEARPAVHSGPVLVNRWETTDVQRELISIPIQNNETFFTNTVARWSDFAKGDSPHSLLLHGMDQTSYVHRFLWLDADGREHARLSVDADGGPFRGVQMTRSSFNGAAFATFRVVFLRTEPRPDGGTEPPPLSMWTYETVCTAVDAGL